MLPADFDTDTHFNPKYNPWEQRVCLVPDGDFFQAVVSVLLTFHRFTVVVKALLRQCIQAVVSVLAVSLSWAHSILFEVVGGGVTAGRGNSGNRPITSHYRLLNIKSAIESHISAGRWNRRCGNRQNRTHH
jgi:hypothetical protein